ncbi:MarR family winged helix-turn-helix transcriptional regulator [Actinomadura sp. WMMA1423]|uniref:MarR family winged helix-turn-helix transcriptional regulator n=1 Tax=Actinomadura sp. WMMA1423 TaxID=2591108 RepID=UPI0011466D77|nr:MarR family transcriptional regulator [Actinomadura sp. WMMA1423]
MDGVELFLLGRTLMKIGEEALPTEGIGRHSTSVRTVLIVVSDVRTHPGSAVGEIAARTGLPQSAVSAAVARLREVGAVSAEPDPGDRRRVRIHPVSPPSARVEEIRASSVDGALAAALDTDDPSRVAEIVGLLEELARHLTPQAVTRLRGSSSA